MFINKTAIDRYDWTKIIVAKYEMLNNILMVKSNMKIVQYC